MTVAGHHVPVWYDEATGPANGQGVFWNASTQRWESADVDISALDTAGLATDAALTAGLATKQDTIPPGTYAEMIALAGNPDLLIAGAITRDANDAAISAPVVWPNGTVGTYTATTVSTAFPGAVDSYTITYGSPVTRTYTQAAVTRNASGAVTNRPAITAA